MLARCQARIVGFSSVPVPSPRHDSLLRGCDRNIVGICDNVNKFLLSTYLHKLMGNFRCHYIMQYFGETSVLRIYIVSGLPRVRRISFNRGANGYFHTVEHD